MAVRKPPDGESPDETTSGIPFPGGLVDGEEGALELMRMFFPPGFLRLMEELSAGKILPHQVEDRLGELKVEMEDHYDSFDEGARERVGEFMERMTSTQEGVEFVLGMQDWAAREKLSEVMSNPTANRLRVWLISLRERWPDAADEINGRATVEGFRWQASVGAVGSTYRELENIEHRGTAEGLRAAAHAIRGLLQTRYEPFIFMLDDIFSGCGLFKRIEHKQFGVSHARVAGVIAREFPDERWLLIDDATHYRNAAAHEKLRYVPEERALEFVDRGRDGRIRFRKLMNEESLGALYTRVHELVGLGSGVELCLGGAVYALAGMGQFDFRAELEMALRKGLDGGDA